MRTAYPFCSQNIVALGFAFATLLGCGVTSEYGEGARMAKAASSCETLETFTPIPARYVRLRSHKVYSGCGKYILVRCMTTTALTQCSVLEVIDKAQGQVERADL
jgi:hypothetical protein